MKSREELKKELLQITALQKKVLDTLHNTEDEKIKAECLIVLSIIELELMKKVAYTN